VQSKKETIMLDAVVVYMIKESVFVAELANGHRLVAWLHGLCKGVSKLGRVIVGDEVVVEMRPSDMEHGEIVACWQEQGS